MTLDPPAVSVVNPAGGSRLVLVCEHASNHIPAAYAGLGLPPEALLRHIAWDIGAAALARRLSALLDAPLFLAGGSRLLIDCNRPLGVPSSIPARSEATEIPGNQDLDAAERDRRAARWFHPFHRRIAAALDARAAAGRPTAVLGIHSFTPRYLGAARPWHAGILYGAAEGFGQALVRALRAEAGLVVGDNEPYRVNALEDYTAPVHGDRRGLEAALVEVRQDLLGDDAGVAAWAARLGTVLRPHGTVQQG
jgi:predicted N-formylglutamate amidohydrolase